MRVSNGGHYETSPPSIPASGRWRCRAPVRIEHLAGAQTYPSRPITIVVGAAAGGATDVIARMMAERMKSSLGQPIIVEDVTGAGGTIAAGRVARAAPDGYTLS